jgi:hypothetical protein
MFQALCVVKKEIEIKVDSLVCLVEGRGGGTPDKKLSHWLAQQQVLLNVDLMMISFGKSLFSDTFPIGLNSTNY